MKKNNNGKKHIEKINSDDKLQSDNKPDSKTLTDQEVAHLIRIHRSTVTRLAKSGEI